MAPTLQPHVRTSRLVLRSARVEDAAHIARLFQNPRSTEFEPHKPANPTTEHYQNRIPSWNQRRDRGEAAMMVIAKPSPEEPNDDSHVIGMGGINSIVEKDATRVAEVGVLIDSPEWRQGFGREALAATFDYAFDEAECDVVEMMTMSINTPFQKLAERMGLGAFKKTVENGMEVAYSITKTEWKSIQN